MYTFAGEAAFSVFVEVVAGRISGGWRSVLTYLRVDALGWAHFASYP